MTYSYEAQKSKLFTDDGQRTLLKVRDNAFRLIAAAGVVRWEEMTLGIGGDSWYLLACADRLVELGDLVEIPQERCAGQHRVFYRPSFG
jgi:hypothetical protein